MMANDNVILMGMMTMTLLKKLLFKIIYSIIVVALAIVIIYVFFLGVGNLLSALLL